MRGTTSSLLAAAGFDKLGPALFARTRNGQSVFVEVGEGSVLTYLCSSEPAGPAQRSEVQVYSGHETLAVGRALHDMRLASPRGPVPPAESSPQVPTAASLG